MAFIQAGPVKLEYWEQGSGPRTWVLIHGFRSSSLIWDALQSHLAAAGDRSTAISMRGAGGSDETPDDEDYAPAHFAQDVRAAVEALGLTEPFYLVGHSLGASTVTHYAREHAGSIAGLVLLAGGAMRPRQPRTDAERAIWLQQIDEYPGSIDRSYWEARAFRALAGDPRSAVGGLAARLEAAPARRACGGRGRPDRARADVALDAGADAGDVR